MKMTRMQVLASACCLALPLTLAAQTSPADPTAPTTTTTGNQTSPTGTPSSTSGQMTPGVTRQNPTSAPNYTAEGAAPMGAGADTSMMDKKFLKDASEGGMAEVQLGQLAASKAESPAVKSYGQHMVTDHTSLNNELKPFADKEGVPPPAALKAEDQAELDKLNGLSGADFDKEYVAFMMKDHKKDQADFRQEASMTSNQQLKMAVMKGERVVSEHKRMIDKIGASMGVSAGM